MIFILTINLVIRVGQQIANIMIARTKVTRPSPFGGTVSMLNSPRRRAAAQVVGGISEQGVYVYVKHSVAQELQ